MKKSILLCVSFLLTLAAFSQEPTLKAKLRCRTIASEPLPVDSVVNLVFSNHDLHGGRFRFSYRNALNDADVKRSFAIQDSSGKQLWSAEGSSFKIKAATLRQLLSVSALKIYSMAIPADPEKAKIVRVRPILVAELTLKP